MENCNAPIRNEASTNTRFQVGDRVLAHIEGGFQPGTIVALNYHEEGWLGDVPYQIALDDGKGNDGVTLIYAPFDDDSCVRAFPKFGLGEQGYSAYEFASLQQELCVTAGKRRRVGERV